MMKQFQSVSMCEALGSILNTSRDGKSPKSVRWEERAITADTWMTQSFPCFPWPE